mgnify:CR=1 FL=1
MPASASLVTVEYKMNILTPAKGDLTAIGDPAAFVAGLDEKQKAELDRILAAEYALRWEWRSKLPPSLTSNLGRRRKTLSHN